MKVSEIANINLMQNFDLKAGLSHKNYFVKLASDDANQNSW